MRFIKRSALSLLLFFTTIAALLAQGAGDHPNQVNGPVTKTNPRFFDTPFLWIGLVVFALAIVLIFLKKGKTSTYGSKHVEQKSTIRR